MDPTGLWRRFTRGLWVLTHRREADRELREELRHYVELSAEEARARGMSPDAARRAALLEVGNLTAVRERVRDAGWESTLGAISADLRYAARRLRRAPGFTAASAITLALGIGATTAIFSVVNPILFASLPYPRAERITVISDVGAGGAAVDVTFGTFLELRQRSRGFEAMAAFKGWRPTILGVAEPERLTGQRVNAGYFRALGVAPALGRDFDDVEDRVNGPNVVILSDATWRRRFAADPAIVGRAIRLNDADYQVVGVMPAGFENVLAPLAELWAPLQYAAVFGPDSREWGHHLRIVARRRAGVSSEQGARELAAIARAPIPDFPRVPWASLQSGLVTTSLQADVTRGVRPALVAVLGAVALLLAIACVNVTNLLLARGAQQRGEFAMRVALGAGRGRLMRQSLAESLLLAVLGGALGMLVAQFGVSALVALSPAELPRVNAIRLDGYVFAFGAAVTTMIGVAVGIMPALHASRQDPHAALQASSRRTAGGHHRTRGSLVVAEVALAVVLLVGAGLLLRSIERVLAVAVGFDASHLLTMQVQETGTRFPTDGDSYRAFAEALQAVQGVPGVVSAAFTSQLPLSEDLDGYGVRFEGDLDLKNGGSALRYAVAPGYFETMRIPLRRGRLLDAHDRAGAPRAVILNESYAQRVFPGQDPIGRRLQFGPDEGQMYTIVGVVGDVRQSSLALDEPDAIYVPASQWHWGDPVMTIVIRARGEPASLTPAVRAAIRSVDKNAPIFRIATMDELLQRSIEDRHFALVLFEVFGLVALVLAATGIYGVLSGTVTERLREIGVRAALGATPREIVGLVIGKGMSLTLIGVAIGTLAALVATRAVDSLLFGVTRLDPPTYASVIVLLVGVSALACGLPARRAARVDPVSTLRAD